MKEEEKKISQLEAKHTAHSKINSGSVPELTGGLQFFLIARFLPLSYFLSFRFLSFRNFPNSLETLFLMTLS